MFVCTYDEAARVVESTLIGCRAIAVPHRTYLLDDGRRPEMRELAEHLDATYLTRPDNSHAKAGNINHALGETRGELILMLDADHVPRSDILDATIGYFTDPHVALVQTPHDFSNRDSVQHTKVARHEQSLFYDVIAPGKDRQNAMFWCGSATLVRRVALVEVGGVLTDTVAEDFHTTIAMHARQWKTRYHPETLVQGLAPHDLAAFLLQRARWARGNLAVFRTRQNPLTCRGLSLGQRTSYFASLFNYFASLQRLALLLVLTITLVSGWLPMHASAVTLAALWLPWCVLAFSATIALGRGTLGPLDSTRYGLMTMGINLRGVLALCTRKAGAFKVTPKEGIDDGGVKVLRMLALVTITGMALGAAVLLRALATAGVLTLPAMDPFVTAVVLVFGAWELGCIAKVLVPLVRRHQLRTRFRTAVRMQARVESTAVRVEILDLSSDGLSFASGALVRTRRAAQPVDPGARPHRASLPTWRSPSRYGASQPARTGASASAAASSSRTHRPTNNWWSSATWCSRCRSPPARPRFPSRRPCGGPGPAERPRASDPARARLTGPAGSIDLRPHALVAQRIEHRPPEPCAQVRVLPRAPIARDPTLPRAPMQAMLLPGPHQDLVWSEVPRPIPDEQQVLLRVRACAVCRTDLHIVDGELDRPKLPLILGHEIVGVVEECGARVDRFAVGDRVGVPWVAWTCGECSFCRSGRENLCDRARFTGYDVDGGYAELTSADARFCFALPDSYSDDAAAPLLCAGLIGYRTLRLAGDAERVGLYGFGAAAHIIAQVLVDQGREFYAFTRPGDVPAQDFARSLGAAWVGGSDAPPPDRLDAALIFAPDGSLVPRALRAVEKGGTVVCGGIHMSDIPAFPYADLWEEHVIRSVANLTRRDGEEFLSLAAQVPIETHTTGYPLDRANEALTDLRAGKVEGAAVLHP